MNEIERADLLDSLYSAGAIDLDARRRTIGFERRPVHTDLLTKDAVSSMAVEYPIDEEPEL